jgi:hypothetical protein
MYIDSIGIYAVSLEWCEQSKSGLKDSVAIKSFIAEENTGQCI